MAGILRKFVPITGERSVPEDIAPAKPDLADILAKIELDHLHVTASPGVLMDALQPLFGYLKMPCEENSENGILKHLNKALNKQDFIQFQNLLNGQNLLLFSVIHHYRSLKPALFNGNCCIRNMELNC